MGSLAWLSGRESTSWQADSSSAEPQPSPHTRNLPPATTTSSSSVPPPPIMPPTKPAPGDGPQPLPHPKYSLNMLPSMFHAILVQMADVFNSPQRHQTRAVMYTNAQLNISIPAAYDRFHFGLDALEMDIVRAKEALRREYEAKRRKPTPPPPTPPPPPPAAEVVVIDDDNAGAEGGVAAEAGAGTGNEMDFLFGDSPPTNGMKIEESQELASKEDKAETAVNPSFDDFLASIPVGVGAGGTSGNQGGVEEVKMEDSGSFGEDSFGDLFNY